MTIKEKYTGYTMKAKKVLTIFGLILLQYIIDVLYVYVYPTVNPIRALMIGASALLILGIIHITKNKLVNPLTGALSIYSSALFGALLVQAELLVSKSFLSGIVHALILIVSFILLDYAYNKYKNKN